MAEGQRDASHGVEYSMHMCEQRGLLLRGELSVRREPCGMRGNRHPGRKSSKGKPATRGKSGMF